MNKNNKLVIFESKQIHRAWHKGEWFFSVVDIIEVLTESPYPRQYWEKSKTKRIYRHLVVPNLATTEIRKFR